MKRAFAKNKKLIVANWKMNPSYLDEAKKIFAILKKKKVNAGKFKTVICPPVVYLSDLKGNYRGQTFSFGAQDVFWQDEGDYTGQISPQMIKNLGVEYVIVGHSENREIGDADEIVSSKLNAVVVAGMNGILCIGEKERDHHGKYLREVEEQLFKSLSKFNKKNLSKLVIAYEPVWAIGKGKKAISPYELHQMVMFIKKHLIRLYGHALGMMVPILYGGSVDADNAGEILSDGEVNGLLIGRASLNPHILGDILKK